MREPTRNDDWTNTLFVVAVLSAGGLAGVTWLGAQLAALLAGKDTLSAGIGDALTALPELDGQVDLVISNPPYIPLTEWEYVAPEARDHDPELALFSGEDGLDTIRGLERTAHRLLRPGGVVVIEHADTQGGQVPWIFTEERGWADAADHPDLNNRPRFATARKALP